MYNEIIPNLFLGDLQDAKDFDLLKPDGMIICVLEGRPGNEPFRAIHYPILTSSGHVHSRQLDRLCYVIDAILTKHIPLLVHCAAGIERSPLTVAYYLQGNMMITLDHAYDIIKEKRPQIADRSAWLKVD